MLLYLYNKHCIRNNTLLNIDRIIYVCKDSHIINKLKYNYTENRPTNQVTILKK